jgi:hypothetical protein
MTKRNVKLVQVSELHTQPRRDRSTTSIRLAGRLGLGVLLAFSIFTLRSTGFCASEQDTVLTIIEGLEVNEKKLEGLHATYRAHLKTKADKWYEFDEQFEWWWTKGKFRLDYQGNYIFNSALLPRRYKAAYDGEKGVMLDSGEAMGKKDTFIIDKANIAHFDPMFIAGYALMNGESLSDYFRRALEEGHVSKATFLNKTTPQSDNVVAVELQRPDPKEPKRSYCERYTINVSKGFIPIKTEFLQRELGKDDVLTGELIRDKITDLGKGIQIPGEFSRILYGETDGAMMPFETRKLALEKASIEGTIAESVFRIEPPYGALVSDRILGVTFVFDETFDQSVDKLDRAIDRHLDALVASAKELKKPGAGTGQGTQQPQAKILAPSVKVGAQRDSQLVNIQSHGRKYIIALLCAVLALLLFIGIRIARGLRAK